MGDNTAVTLLELGEGPELRVGIDNCASSGTRSKLILYFNEADNDCAYNGAITSEIYLPKFNEHEWHRLAIEFGQTEIKVYLNCTLVNTTAINRTNCLMNCNKGTNRLMGPLKDSQCTNGGLDVRYIIYIYISIECTIL